MGERALTELLTLKPRFANVLFDLDGTLTDSKPAITKSIKHVLNVLGVPPPSAEDLDWCVGPALWEVFSRLLRTKESPLARLGEAKVFKRSFEASQ